MLDLPNSHGPLSSSKGVPNHQLETKDGLEGARSRKSPSSRHVSDMARLSSGGQMASVKSLDEGAERMGGGGFLNPQVLLSSLILAC